MLVMIAVALSGFEYARNKIIRKPIYMHFSVSLNAFFSVALIL